jgi:hypothetical protein
MKPQEKRFMWILCGGVAALFILAITLAVTGALGLVLDPGTDGGGCMADALRSGMPAGPSLVKRGVGSCIPGGASSEDSI